MKAYITNNKRYAFLFFVSLFLLWEVLSFIYPEMIVPSVNSVVFAIWNITYRGQIISESALTVMRLIVGLVLAIFVGSVLGIAMGLNTKVRSFFMPFIGILQATPPISGLVLAMIWFGLTGKASIFIVFLVTLPIILISIIEGFENISIELLEMAKVFQLSKLQIIKDIIVPSLISYLKAGINIALGLGWKIIVMAEVLSSNTGIGSQITSARLNLSTDLVFAWTIIVIFLCYISQKICDVLFELIGYRGKLE